MLLSLYYCYEKDHTEISNHLHEMMLVKNEISLAATFKSPEQLMQILRVAVYVYAKTLPGAKFDDEMHKVMTQLNRDSSETES